MAKTLGMAKEEQINIRTFPELKSQFLDAARSLKGAVGSHTGGPIRPGQLLEWAAARFVMASPAERVQMAREMRQAQADWLARQEGEDDGGQSGGQDSSSVAARPVAQKTISKSRHDANREHPAVNRPGEPIGRS